MQGGRTNVRTSKRITALPGGLAVRARARMQTLCRTEDERVTEGPAGTEAAAGCPFAAEGVSAGVPDDTGAGGSWMDGRAWRGGDSGVPRW